MKTTLLLLLSLALGGCATSHQTTSHTTKQDPFQLVVVRPRSESGWAIRLPVQLDGEDVAKIKNGSYKELSLAPGTYILSSRRGKVLGHDFPPARISITAVAGERRIYCYVIEYGPKVVSYPVAPGVDMKGVAAQPFKAKWEEITAEDFEKNFADATLDD